MTKQLIKYSREEIMQAYNEYKNVCHTDSYNCHAIISAYNKYISMVKGSGLDINSGMESSNASDFDDDFKPVRMDYD